MAINTSFLNLKQIDRATEATTKLVGEWIDDINDLNFGNMRKIDEGFGNLHTRLTNQEDKSGGLEEDLQEHIDVTVADDEGVHGIRYDGENLEIYDEVEGWKQISFDLSHIQPDTFIISIPMTTETYYTTWQLHRGVGGIHAPLDGWGFTNAVVTGIPFKPVMDFNNNTISFFSLEEFAGHTWTYEELQDGVFVISATTTNVALILVRR